MTEIRQLFCKQKSGAKKTKLKKKQKTKNSKK